MITLDMGITLAVLAAAVILFITEWLQVDLVALGVVISLMVSRVLTPQEALAGFSSPIVVTVAALFIVGGTVMETGLADIISQRIIRLAGDSTIRLLVLIIGTVALLSGFISDTGTVAVMAPAIISISRKQNINPSKLLIPLSIGSLLGGSMTLIGTPPNIIVSDLLLENGYQPFSFFDFTPLGLVLLLSGVVFLTTTYHWLLPDHTPSQEFQRVPSPEALVEIYQLQDNLYRLRVRSQSPLVGQTLKTSGLRDHFQVTVLEIRRPPRQRPIGRFGENNLLLQDEKPLVIQPKPDRKIKEDDILICQGEIDNITHVSASLNLAVQPAEANDHNALVNNEVGVAEVLLPPRSQLIGKTLVSSRFGSLYQLTVLGINRPGEDQSLPLKETELRFGDTLFVQGPWKNIQRLTSMRRDFVVVGQPEGIQGSQPRSKMILAGAILAGMLILLVTNWLPLATTALIAGFLMITMGCVEMKDAYSMVDWRSVILIAGMLPMTTAMEKVGLVQSGADWIASTFSGAGTMVTMAALFLITSLFTQVLSNTATTVLIAPIALSLAVRLGYQPQAFLMLIAFAASAAYASPVASPVNTLVIGAGDYRFRDFLKVGAPLILLVMVITVLLLPLLWPL